MRDEYDNAEFFPFRNLTVGTGTGTIVYRSGQKVKYANPDSQRSKILGEIVSFRVKNDDGKAPPEPDQDAKFEMQSTGWFVIQRLPKAYWGPSCKDEIEVSKCLTAKDGCEQLEDKEYSKEAKKYKDGVNVRLEVYLVTYGPNNDETSRKRLTPNGEYPVPAYDKDSMKNGNVGSRLAISDFKLVATLT